MTANHFLSPYFLYGLLSGYLSADNEQMQQDGVTLHFGGQQMPKSSFSNHWIGCESENAPAPLPLHPRSPDPTIPENAFWRLVKEELWNRWYVNNDLRYEICAAFKIITSDLLKQMNKQIWSWLKLCYDNGGVNSCFICKIMCCCFLGFFLNRIIIYYISLINLCSSG